jgi:hypothetical protein
MIILFILVRPFFPDLINLVTEIDVLRRLFLQGVRQKKHNSRKTTIQYFVVLKKQNDINNLNISITSYETRAVIKSLPTKRSPGSNKSLLKF